MTRKALERLEIFASTVEGGGFGGTPGIPDLHYAGRFPCLRRHPACATYAEGWIELKVLAADKIPARVLRGDAPLMTGLEHYTAQQRVWHTLMARAGGRIHLFLRVDHGDAPRFYLYEGGWAAENLGGPRSTVMYAQMQRLSLLGHFHNPLRFPAPEHLARALVGLGDCHEVPDAPSADA